MSDDARSIARMRALDALDPKYGRGTVNFASMGRRPAWFGPSVWNGRPAFRLSLSSWRTEDADIERLIAQLTRLLKERHRTA